MKTVLSIIVVLAVLAVATASASNGTTAPKGGNQASVQVTDRGNVLLNSTLQGSYVEVIVRTQDIVSERNAGTYTFIHLRRPTRIWVNAEGQ